MARDTAYDHQPSKHHQIKYFQIMGESSDGLRFVGKLDNGEKMSYPKKSRGWAVYEAQDEYQQAKAV